MELESLTSSSESRLSVKNTFINIEIDDGQQLRWCSESKAECSLQSSRRCSLLSDVSDAKHAEPSECETDEGVDQQATFSSSESMAEKPSWADMMDDECDICAAKGEMPASVPAVAEPPARLPKQPPTLGAGDARVSVGSVHHPHLCNQPCRWAAMGACAAGVECTFCHCAHDGRRNSFFDKRNREYLRKLSGVTFASLLTPALTQKVAELDMTHHVNAVLQNWIRAVDLASEGDLSHKQLKASEARRLTRCFETLTVNVLCRTYVAYSDDRDLATLMQDLLASLQTLAAEQSTSGA